MDKKSTSDEVSTSSGNFIVPNGKVIIFLNTPFTYVDYPLCPLNLMSVNTLKLISFLKNKGNQVYFINMCSDETHFWKDKSAGRDGNVTLAMSIMGKPRWFMVEELKKIGEAPDEIWISGVFTFDHEVVKAIIDTSREIFPRAKIVVGGDFVRSAPALAAGMKVIACPDRIKEADLCEPDFSVQTNWDYGLFQLEIGCPNRCAFCIAGMDNPQVIDIDRVIAYMKDFYAKYTPSVFWNWDPNVLVFREKYEEFLDKYAASGMQAGLKFGKGFQPDLLTEELIRKMAKTARISASLPIEAADSYTIQQYKKPYSIISSIKVLTMAAKYKFNLKNSQCTFVIGYPDDRFSSIFRAYLTILILGGKPTPFPVFLFPLSEDYERYKELIKHKDLSELHGQLWPLINSSELPKYQNLLKFLHIPTLEKANQNISLLTPDLQELYKRELYLIDDFIELCQNAKADCLEELKNIENKLENKLENYEMDGRKKRIVYIVANPKSEEKSISRQLGSYFFEKYRENNKDVEIDVIDLYKEEIPFINEEFIDVIFKAPTQVSLQTERTILMTDRYIKMLRRADKIVIACPMWSFSIPSILKAFFEIVMGRLFYYYQQTMEKKPVLCILTRDGSYPLPSAGAQPKRPKYINVQELSIIAALEFMGIGNNIKFVCVEGLFREENRQSAIDKAKNQLNQLAREF